MSCMEGASVHTSVNSSPPKRAMKSRGVTSERRRSATARNTASPYSCPRLSLMVLKLSRSMNSTRERVPRGARAFHRRVQIGEELPAVRQVGERIVMRKVSQLARALRDSILELRLIAAHRLLGHGQLLGHVVERVRELIDLAHASRFHSRRERARGELARTRHEATHGTATPSIAASGNRENHREHHYAEPEEQALCVLGGDARRARRSPQRLPRPAPADGCGPGSAGVPRPRRRPADCFRAADPGSPRCAAHERRSRGLL